MNPRPALLAALLVASTAIACGHKAPPVPPPLRNPAPTYDLKIQQRGDELILSFTYPQTTVGGLPLTALAKVEFWELVKPLTPPLDEAGEGEEDGEEEAATDAGEPDGAAPEGAAGEAAAAETGADEGQDAAAPEEPGEEPGEEPSEDEEPEEVVPLGATPETLLPPPPTKEQIAAVELLEFDATAQLRLVLESEELAAATVGDQIVLRLPFGEAKPEETAYVYSIKTFADEKKVSGWSNLATLVRRQPPPTPEDFQVEAEAGGIRITWFNQRAEDRRKEIEEAAAAGLAPPPPAPMAPAAPGEENSEEPRAYRIYRRDAQARVYGPQIGQLPPDSDEYLDRTAQYGNRYIYALTAVGLYSPLVESSLAGEIEIDYQDRFAPPAPLNPIALAEPGRVRVLWDASPAPDLRGYIVFRRQRGEPDFAPLTARPIVDLEYNDRDVAPATDYEYRIAAIDREGNEGEPSATVGARTP